MLQSMVQHFCLVTMSCGLISLADAWTYHHSTELLTWENARRWCRSHYTDMVAIQNKVENEYLNRSLPPNNKSYYWIGIRKINNIWTWVGTNKALTADAKNWAPGEPNNKKNEQDCVEIYIQRKHDPGKWNDEPCGKKKIALCFLANCKSSSCNQNGDCVETIGNYTCECHPGFYGPECQHVVNCEHLDLHQNHTVTHCTHHHGEFTYSSKCTYHCEEGFDLKGSDVLECSASGKWTAEAPKCEATSCSILNSPEGGYTMCNHHYQPFSYNSTCWFGCEEGFHLAGANILVCSASGQWTGELPTCEVAKCGALKAPTHGGIRCSNLHGDFEYSSSCSFGCADGFSLAGSQAAVCTAAGNWSAPAPECKAVHCQPFDIPKQGQMRCSHPYGHFSYESTCDFDCEMGFLLMGQRKLQCSDSGNWTAPTPECRAVKCGPLLKSTQGHMSCLHPIEEFSYNSTCGFSCVKGFLLVGAERLTCDSTGKWSAPTPTCAAVKCAPLLAPMQGNMSCVHPFEGFRYNSTCEFGCGEGFLLMGSERLSCDTSGNWSARMPTCTAVNCAPLLAPTQGNMSCVHPFQGFSYNSTCEFSCGEGFLLMGSERLSCDTSGNWSAPMPTCAAVKCAPLLAPTQGNLSCVHPFEGFSYNSTCEFSCAEGFLLMGSERLSCDTSGNWSAPTPTCAAVKCGLLFAPTQGTMRCVHPFDEFSYNATCKFKCSEGFLLMGSERLSCNTSGNWSSPTPTCAAVKCAPLLVPAQGNMSCVHPFEEFSYNSSCGFSCNEGFHLMGSERQSCNTSGNWSAPTPVCAGASFQKQVLQYGGGSAVAAIGLIMSGALLAGAIRHFNRKKEDRALLNSPSKSTSSITENPAFEENF